MRSEERAGIVAAVLLLLWGTVLTFPLHICSDFYESTLNGVISNIWEAAPSALHAGIIVVMFTLAEVLLLLLSKTGFAVYIPAYSAAVTSLAFIVRCIRTMVFDTGAGIALAVLLAGIAILHFLKLEKILIWLSDFFIYSLSAFLFTSLVAAPLSKLSPVLDKIFYIKNLQSTDLTEAFAGFLTLPAAVWGIFFFILFTLPVIYYSFSRKKA